MVDSGERLDLSGVGLPTVDKHSTGGVGDKVSLILAPLVAACGAAVPAAVRPRARPHRRHPGQAGVHPRLAGRPAARRDARRSCAGRLRHLRGRARPGPGGPRLYALRDVTGTVESIPLIASSIMSKKIAEGTAALVLDVKVGSGAFMRDLADARLLARDDGGARRRSTGCGPPRCSPGWTCRSAGRSATRSRSRRRSRRCRAGATRPGRGDARAGPRDAAAGGAARATRRRRWRTAGRWTRYRDDDRGAGRRSGRAAAAGRAHQALAAPARLAGAPAGRARGRRGRLAARRRPRAQGGPGEPGRGRAVPREAR